MIIDLGIRESPMETFQKPSSAMDCSLWVIHGDGSRHESVGLGSWELGEGGIGLCSPCMGQLIGKVAHPCQPCIALHVGDLRLIGNLTQLIPRFTKLVCAMRALTVGGACARAKLLCSTEQCLCHFAAEDLSSQKTRQLLTAGQEDKVICEPDLMQGCNQEISLIVPVVEIDDALP